MEVQNGNLRPRQRGEPVDGIVLGQVFGQFAPAHAVGGARLVQARPTGLVAHRVDAADALDAVRVLGRPVVEHQPAAALRQQAGPPVQPVMLYHRAVEVGEDGAAGGISERFAHVHSGNGHAARHAAARKASRAPRRAARPGADEGGGVPDPGFRAVGGRLGRQDDEAGVPVGKAEVLPPCAELLRLLDLGNLGRCRRGCLGRLGRSGRGGGEDQCCQHDGGSHLLPPKD